jgi:hypothetical protein
MLQLATTQEMLLLSMVWSLWDDWELHKLRDSTMGFGWSAYIAFCAMVQVVSTLYIDLPESTGKVFKNLAKKCQTRQLHFSGYIASSTSPRSSFKYLIIGAAVGLGLIILGGVLAVTRRTMLECHS